MELVWIKTRPKWSRVLHYRNDNDKNLDLSHIFIKNKNALELNSDVIHDTETVAKWVRENENMTSFHHNDGLFPLFKRRIRNVPDNNIIILNVESWHNVWYFVTHGDKLKSIVGLRSVRVMIGHHFILNYLFLIHRAKKLVTSFDYYYCYYYWLRDLRLRYWARRGMESYKFNYNLADDYLWYLTNEYWC